MNSRENDIKFVARLRFRAERVVSRCGHDHDNYIHATAVRDALETMADEYEAIFIEGKDGSWV